MSEAEAVATLGLTEEVEALRAANAAFDADYSKKAAEASEMDAQSDIKSKDVVEDANTRYAEIVQIVNAYAIVQPSDEINQFINDLNGLVAIYSKIAGSSSGSGSTTETPDEENPGTEPENPDGGDGGDEENPSGPGIPNP